MQINATFFIGGISEQAYKPWKLLERVSEDIEDDVAYNMILLPCICPRGGTHGIPNKSKSTPRCPASKKTMWTFCGDSFWGHDSTIDVWGFEACDTGIMWNLAAGLLILFDYALNYVHYSFLFGFDKMSGFLVFPLYNMRCQIFNMCFETMISTSEFPYT